VRAQYVLRLERLRIGYRCTFGCNYPDDEAIGWEEGPSRWRLTRAGAMRYARRRERWHGRLDAPIARVEEITLTDPEADRLLAAIREEGL
jgi:hypothetical protein